jgi:cytochrome b subunit of formate dehydrogenase
MADNTTNDTNGKETVDAASIGKGNNPVSKATLVMIAAAIIFIIIAGVIISRLYSSPTGANGSGSPNSTSTTNR